MGGGGPQHRVTAWIDDRQLATDCKNFLDTKIFPLFVTEVRQKLSRFALSFVN